MVLIDLLGTIYRLLVKPCLIKQWLYKSADCPIQNIEVSSAYINRDPEHTAGSRSLVNKVKRVAPSTDPDGIPAVTSSRSDATPFNTVNCILSVK